MQRLLLKIENETSLIPMTQLLEELPMPAVNASTGLPDTVQFVLRIGYIKTYLELVSVRRSVN